MISPSNSGILRTVGDVVALTRDPAHDAVGVQLHGTGDGVELIFEGSTGGGWFALPVEGGPDALPLKSDGRFAYLIPAAGINRVQVRLAALKSGQVNCAIFSGMGDAMKHAAGPTPAPGAAPKPVKLARAVPPAGSGPGPFRVYPSNGKFYVIDESTQRSGEPFKTKALAEAWISQQLSAAKAAPKTGNTAAALPYTVKEIDGRFVAYNAAGQSEAFATWAEADQWGAAQK